MDKLYKDKEWLEKELIQKSPTQITKEQGVGLHTICRWIKKFGLKIEYHRNNTYQNKKWLEKETKIKHFKQIAQECNVSTATISLWANRFKVQRVSPLQYSARDKQYLLDHPDTNVKILAKKLNRSIQSICQQRSRLGIHKIIVRLILDNDQFIKMWNLYVKRECTKRDIANYFQCSMATIDAKRRELKIPQKIAKSDIKRDKNNNIVKKGCCKCNKLLLISNFCDKYNKYGNNVYNNICKKCATQYQIKYRRNKNNWAKLLYLKAKKRAKKKNVKFSLTIDDIQARLEQQGYQCPVFNIPYEMDKYITDNKFRKGLSRPQKSASIDETIPNKGYTQNNFDIMSNRANDLKKDGTLDEFEALVKYLRVKK